MRLTYKDKEDYFSHSEGEALNKLGQLENIEDELGIGLDDYFKLFELKHVYCWGHTGINKCNITGINTYNKTITVWNGACNSTYSFFGYLKDWAFTEEGLKEGIE